MKLLFEFLPYGIMILYLYMTNWLINDHIHTFTNFTGLQRTGKSCRLRWLNYLRPDVRRGNITLEEQLLILELHSRWGNRYVLND